MIRRVRYAVGAALAATVLSGCVGLHADPAIRTGLAVGADSGDRVVYVVRWTRMGGQGGFTVTNPLPKKVYYQGSADGREEVSLDGGRSWGKLDALRVGNRLATPEDVTHVRWRVPANEAARGSGQITYSAIVR